MRAPHLLPGLLVPGLLLLVSGCANVAAQDPFQSTSSLDDAAREIAVQAEREGDFDMAANMLDRLRLEPHAPATIAREQARLLALAGRYDEAEKILRAYMERNSDDAIGARQLANLLLQQDKPADALAALDHRPPSDPPPLWLNTRGAVLDRLRRGTDAQEAYRTALVKSPDDPVIAANLAISLLLANDRPGALAVMKTLRLEAVLRERQGWNLALVLAANHQAFEAGRVLTAMGRGRNVTTDVAQLSDLVALPPAALRQALAPRVLRPDGTKR